MKPSTRWQNNNNNNNTNICKADNVRGSGTAAKQLIIFFYKIQYRILHSQGRTNSWMMIRASFFAALKLKKKSRLFFRKSALISCILFNYWGKSREGKSSDQKRMICTRYQCGLCAHFRTIGRNSGQVAKMCKKVAPHIRLKVVIKLHHKFAPNYMPINWWESGFNWLQRPPKAVKQKLQKLARIITKFNTYSVSESSMSAT